MCGRKVAFLIIIEVIWPFQKLTFQEHIGVCEPRISFTCQGGGQTVYLVFVILGQLMPVANPDPPVNLETHVFKENKAILYVPVYNKQQVCMAISQKR